MSDEQRKNRKLSSKIERGQLSSKQEGFTSPQESESPNRHVIFRYRDDDEGSVDDMEHPGPGPPPRMQSNDNILNLSSEQNTSKTYIGELDNSGFMYKSDKVIVIPEREKDTSSLLQKPVEKEENNVADVIKQQETTKKIDMPQKQEIDSLSLDAPINKEHTQGSHSD